MKADLSKQVAGRILSLQKSGEDDVVFAERVGLSAQGVSNYKLKKNGAGLDAVVKVLKHVPRLSAMWLLNDEPPQYLPPDSEAVELAIRLEVIGRIKEGGISPDALKILARGSAERIADALENLIGPSSGEA